MTTLADLIEGVLEKLDGFNNDYSLYGQLLESIDETDTIIKITNLPVDINFGTGVAEIGNELIYVQSVTRTGPTSVTLSNVIRGYRGTTKQEHLSDTLVRNNPKISRAAITKEINNTIASLYPRIKAVKTSYIKTEAYNTQYQLPDNTLTVLEVSVLENVFIKTNNWIKSNRWHFDFTAGQNNAEDVVDLEDIETQKALRVFDALYDRTIQVVYAVEPEQLLTEADTLEDTGLPSWTREMIEVGAAYRLVSFIDMKDYANNTAEQRYISKGQQQQPANQLARYFLALFEQLVTNGSNRQAKEYPPVKHFIR